jgi:2,5-dihydroxypyridine 5,6-dioxygenase
LAKTEGLALAKANRPGGYFVPGTVLLIPELESVRGIIRCDAAFHEYYCAMREPLSLEVDGTVKRVTGGGSEQSLMERALLRAGGNKYGYVVHFSCGIHPGARFTGTSFIEDQRVVGYNAVGLGLPPWMPGGGENHPDAIMSLQTIEIDHQTIVKDGRIVAPVDLVELANVLNAELA